MKTDEVIEKFSQMMIERMEQIKSSNWTKGWIGTIFNERPMNLSKRPYSGTNMFFLYLLCMKEEYKYPIFATFKQIKALNGSVNKGEKSFPVLYWNIQYKDKQGNKIEYDEYNELSKEQKKSYEAQPYLKSYNVFNIAQTNLEEAAPKIKEKFKSIFTTEAIPTDTQGMYENESLDEMLANQSWVCPIQYEKFSEGAFYSISSDEIIMPKKSQFKRGTSKEDVFNDGQEYYSTLLHEMTHSTGSKDRLKRFDGKPNSPEDEELVAELSSALIGQMMGFDKKILDNNAAYVDGWIKKLKKTPKYIVHVMSEVNKASQMIMDKIWGGNEEEVQVAAGSAISN